jgi:N-acetylmuramoyl-L-alanine amidase
VKPAALFIVILLAALSTAFMFERDTTSLHDAAADTAIAALAPEPVWTRPDGPVRVALQAGHWKAGEAPDEQAGLRTNGTRGGGLAEWQVNLAIAERAARLLEASGIEVDILPTTIPPGYWADAFVAIHADGNPNASVSGYRAAAPRRDRTGRAETLVEMLTETYGAATGLPVYPTITRRMRGYYAFNSRRYHHALHPMTVGVILETGFLTSPRDRRIIVDAQDRAARGIADAVVRFLEPLADSLADGPGAAVAPAP